MAELLIGLVIAGATLRDVFDTVVVPGGSHATLHAARRLVFVLLPVWKKVRGRERGLSTLFAPFVLVAAFALWMLLLAIGFGLMVHAVGTQFSPPVASYGDSIFTAGSALVTIGEGSSRAGGVARWVILAAGFCGLAVMTMAVTYLLEVQSSISRRDRGILKLATSAGDPPSALGLLEKYAAIGARGELGHVLRDGRDWCATVLQSHASHPSLIYFRTIGTGSGWPAALGALLDLALIVERWIDAEELRGLAVLLREDGRKMSEALGSLIGLEPCAARPGEAETQGLDRRLAAAGYPRRAGFDGPAFARERAAHDAWIEALAAHLGRSPAPLLPAEA
ncbi:MAG: hypothetical protein ACJ8EB_14700 [Allosphingosinicella sp.]